MLTRVYIILIAAGLAVAPCLASPSGVRDGSTKAKAIPLKQRNPAKAVEEEMAWMMKLYHYTPLLATRDALVDAIRKAKAGKKEVHVSGFWGHASVEHNGHLISNWWFPTPRGKREIYFDTGTSINTPGEVVRQESARGEYMGRMMPPQTAITRLTRSGSEALAVRKVKLNYSGGAGDRAGDVVWKARLSAPRQETL